MAESNDSRDATPDVSRDDPLRTAELLRRARDGDREALELVFMRQFETLRHWSSGRLPHWARDVADTDDLVQDVLLKTFQRIDDFDARGRGALYAYLRQAVLNRMRDEMRRRARRPAPVLADRLLPADGPSPLDLAIGSESLERYEGALDRLKADEKECIVARLELGFTYDELATWMGKPSPEAARKAARRALVRLVEEMERLVSG
jgi:RNA polymerase sigma-70 factor (ECF subfamily)